VNCRCTSITPGAPVKIAGAPGDGRCALALECQVHLPGIRVFETGRTCHSQGAPVDRRWTSITPGASFEYQGHPGRRQGLGLDLWISLRSRSVSSQSVGSGGARPRGAAKQHPRAGAGWWYFLRLRLALLGVSPFRPAAKSAGLHLYQVLNKFAKFVKQLWLFVELPLRSSC
jgi:hypothetical protein